MRGLSLITMALSIVALNAFQKIGSSRAGYVQCSAHLTSGFLCEGSHRIIRPLHSGRSLRYSVQLIRRSASDTYSLDSISNAIAAAADKVWTPIKSKITKSEVSGPLLSTVTKSGHFLRKSWFLFPMLVALVPVYCALVTGTFARMPDWWQMVKMDHVRTGALAQVSFFLFSNISFFVAAGYLLMLFPPSPKTVSVKEGLPIPTKTMKLHIPSAQSMLGVWMLASGLISTVFHSVQAFGPHPIAESLCFIDHAIAGSSLFYFWHMCGPPSRKVWALGLTAFAFLCITSPSWIYTWCHSAWHFIVAFAAVIWVRQSHKDELVGESALSEVSISTSSEMPSPTSYTPKGNESPRIPHVTEIAKFLIQAKAVSIRLERNRAR